MENRKKTQFFISFCDSFSIQITIVTYLQMQAKNEFYRLKKGV